ncbi:hypothetical protein B7C42_07457 [Nocardia cerradoensis]|uniref:DUF6879 domain-containing protein n=1 Tax=Nocardia cerradoensis TaxID=85688 RepID=A0A231GVA4_9NOCA|nr:DUF6879 family protein [Nocardia cerradoensis]OXR40518.1 hypothetical protein B7C42_07457 [Nocardia cerradoensis]
MLLLEGEAFDDLLRTCRHEAFHLEVKDTYSTPNETEPFANFLNGGPPDDYSWLRDWLDLVQETTARGVNVRRARVVTVPHTDYTRWLLDVSFQNADAGEEIRYLSRHLIDADALTADDWWLFDQESVAFTVFEPSGAWRGGALTTDPRIVDYCRQVWNRVWDNAVPHADYAALGIR